MQSNSLLSRQFFAFQGGRKKGRRGKRKGGNSQSKSNTENSVEGSRVRNSSQKEQRRGDHPEEKKAGQVKHLPPEIQAQRQASIDQIIGKATQHPLVISSIDRQNSEVNAAAHNQVGSSLNNLSSHELAAHSEEKIPFSLAEHKKSGRNASFAQIGRPDSAM